MIIFGRYLQVGGGDCQKICFEVFSRAGYDWPLCKFSTLTVIPFMFFVNKYHMFDKNLTKKISLSLLAVSHLFQTASDGFDQNWAKSEPLIFLTLEIFHAMDRSIVQCRSSNSRVLKKCYESFQIAQKTYVRGILFKKIISISIQK